MTRLPPPILSCWRLAIVLSCALSAHAVQFGISHRIPSADFAPFPIGAQSVATIESDDGYLTVWLEPGGLRGVRLDRAHRVLDQPPLLLARWERPGPYDYELSIDGALSDGRTFLVSWSEGIYWMGWHHTHRITRLSWDGTASTSEARPGRWLGAVRSGERAIALVDDEPPGRCCVPASVVATDFAGNVMSRAGTVIFPDAAKGASRRLFAERGRVWLVGAHSYGPAATIFYRVALTDENGNPVTGGEETLPVDGGSYGEQVQAAGLAGDRWYLLTRSSISGPGTFRVRFLSRSGARAVSGWIDLGERNGRSAVAADVDGELVVAFAGAKAQPGFRRLLIVCEVAPSGLVMTTLVRDAGFEAEPVVALFAGRGGVVVFSYDGISILQSRLLRRGSGPLVVLPPVLVSRGGPLVSSLDGAAVGTGAVAVWEQYGVEGMEVHAAPLHADGSPAGPPQFLMRGSAPRIGSNGEVALVVARSAGGWRFLRLGPDARPLGDRPEPVTDLETRGADVEVVWAGSAFVVVFNDHWEPLRAVRIGAGGERLSGAVTLTPAPERDRSGPFPAHPAVAVSSDALLVAWSFEDVRADGAGRVLLARGFTHDLLPLTEPFVLAVTEDDGVTARVIRFGGAFVAVWEDRDFNWSMRVSDSFLKLDAEPAHAGWLPGFETLFVLEGRLFAGGRRLSDIRDQARDVALANGAVARRVLTTADGRSLMLFTALEEANGYRFDRPWARTLTP